MPAKADKDADNLAAVLEKIPQMPARRPRLASACMTSSWRQRPRSSRGCGMACPAMRWAAASRCWSSSGATTTLRSGSREKANLPLDEGAPDRLIPNAWFLKAELDAATEARVAEIVRGAVG